VGIFRSPRADISTDTFRAVEMRDLQIAKMVDDLVEPARPVLPRAVGERLIIGARLIGRHHRFEPARLWCSMLTNSCLICAMKGGGSEISLDRRPSPPCIDVDFPLGLNDMQALVLNRSHAFF